MDCAGALPKAGGQPRMRIGLPIDGCPPACYNTLRDYSESCIILSESLLSVYQ